MTHPRRIAQLVAALSLFAAQAGAVSISLNQIGGTAVGGRGLVGDTVVLSIDVVFEPGNAVTGMQAALQWDAEGGNVLDLVSATESLGTPTAGSDLERINGIFRHGVLGSVGNSFGSVNGNQASFPGGLSGPSFAYGWEQVTFDPAGGLGPVTFSMGTAEFVLTDIGTTTVSFMTDAFEPLDTLVFGPGFLDDITEDVALGNVTLGTLEILVIPEPGTGVLLTLGLASLCLARRRPR